MPRLTGKMIGKGLSRKGAIPNAVQELTSLSILGHEFFGSKKHRYSLEPAASVPLLSVRPWHPLHMSLLIANSLLRGTHWHPCRIAHTVRNIEQYSCPVLSGNIPIFMPFDFYNGCGRTVKLSDWTNPAILTP